MATISVMNDSLDGLVAIYNQLTMVSMERDYLTDAECNFMHIAVGNVAKQLKGQVSDIVPSLESDDYFERNSVQVSMEAIGEGIKEGAKAFLKKIFEMLKGVCTRIAERYKSLTGKLAKLKQKIAIVRQAKTRLSQSEGKPVEKQAPTNTSSATPSPASKESEPEATKAPAVRQFAITITLLKIDGVVDKINSAESMNSYITKLTRHLSNLIRDFNSRMDYGSDTNNFAVDSMKELQNVEVVDTPTQFVIDITREWTTWERWEKNTLPFIERTFTEISKKQVQTKMQEHLTAAERAVNTEKDEAKLNGYRQRINELGKMIKTFDILLGAISSVDVKPLASPPPLP